MTLPRSISMLSLLCRLSSPPKLFPFRRTPPLSSSSSPPLLISLSWFNQAGNRRSRAFGTAVTVAAVSDKKEIDTFFAEESVSWTSLKVSEQLSRALSSIGLHRPSLVQAACMPSISSGNDVVIAAETGSGKTHAYLVPLIDNLCRISDYSEKAVADHEFSQPRQISLVLCPNVMLCEQVVRLANCLCGDDGKPLVNVAAICGRQGSPVTKPDVIVSTPVAFLNYLYAVDPEKHRRAEIIRAIKYVVFDEADMLLCGSFENQIIRIINMLRFDEKVLSRQRSSEVEKSVDLDSGSLLHLAEDDIDLPIDSNEEEDEEVENDIRVEDLTEGSEVVAIKHKGWRRVREIYQRSKQYIFVAATLPVNGKRTAGGVLKRMFPDANWVCGNYLHCHNPRLERTWIEVTVDTQVDALINAVNQGYKSKVLNANTGPSRTMVFANTVDAVEAISKIFLGAGFECLRYHSDTSLEERTNNLVHFQQHGGVFVCTDAAARGLDVPNVSHVIQAEFATSAVNFLHRVGRTGRAGQPGLVTSLYTESNQDLVAAVRQAEKLGQPVEKAFSRKRSFRNKIKKKVASKASDMSHVGERIPA